MENKYPVNSNINITVNTLFSLNGQIWIMMKVEMQVSKIEISVQKLADRQFMITVAKEDHVCICESD